SPVCSEPAGACTDVGRGSRRRAGLGYGEPQIVDAPRAASAHTTPLPYDRASVIHVPRSAVRLRRSLTCAGVVCSPWPISSAATPATNGEAIEVPDEQPCHAGGGTVLYTLAQPLFEKP